MVEENTGEGRNAFLSMIQNSETTEENTDQFNYKEKF